MRFQTIEVGEEVGRIADSLESVQITWLTGLSALVVLVAGLLLARLARRSIRLVGQRTDIVAPRAILVASRLAAYGIVFYAVSASLGILGFDVIPMVSLLGVATIVVALGLRPMIENFAAGLTLQTLHPFDLGDQVSLLGSDGTVRDVTARTVVMETVDGEVVHVPNREVLDNPIVNYTKRGARRTSLDVGLDYGTDLDRATEIMADAVGETAGVLPDPAPTVLVHQFGDSTINASVRFWHLPELDSAWDARHAVALKLKRTLDAAGITIAFPQRVLWWGPTADDGARQPEVDSTIG